jgi:hypothetical protein
MNTMKYTVSHEIINNAQACDAEIITYASGIDDWRVEYIVMPEYGTGYIITNGSYVMLPAEDMDNLKAQWRAMYR